MVSMGNQSSNLKESKAPHTPCKMQINHYDVCLDAFV